MRQYKTSLGETIDLDDPKNYDYLPNNIEELRNSEFLVSIDTSSNINEDIKNVLNIPYIKDGFKKKDSSFKMKNINKEERVKHLAELDDFKINDKNVKYSRR